MTRRAPLVLAALAVLLAVVAALPIGRAVLHGWLAAWLFALGIPMGATVLLFVHGLTGGYWGTALGPVLRGMAALMPFHAVLFIPVLLRLDTLFAWAGDPGAAAATDVADLYLNQPGFIARAVVILGLWTALALCAAAGRTGRLASALALLAYAVSVSFAGTDWIMSLAPEWTTTTVGWSFAATQVLTALAWCALGAAGLDADARDDLARLTVALLLITLYLWFIQYLVIWSGNLPHKVSWFADRAAAPWSWTVCAALLVGTIPPFALLLVSAWRRRAGTVAAAGAATMTGLILVTVWQVLPPSGAPGASLAICAGDGAVLLALYRVCGAVSLPWMPEPAEHADG